MFFAIISKNTENKTFAEFLNEIDYLADICVFEKDDITHKIISIQKYKNSIVVKIIRPNEEYNFYVFNKDLSLFRSDNLIYEDIMNIECLAFDSERMSYIEQISDSEVCLSKDILVQGEEYVSQEEINYMDVNFMYIDNCVTGFVGLVIDNLDNLSKQIVVYKLSDGKVNKIITEQMSCFTSKGILFYDGYSEKSASYSGFKLTGKIKFVGYDGKIKEVKLADVNELINSDEIVDYSFSWELISPK